MAGDSKWVIIKHRKGAQGAKMAKMFTRITKDIQVGVKEGRPDPEKNPRLSMAVRNCRSVNMPTDVFSHLNVLLKNLYRSIFLRKRCLVQPLCLTMRMY